MSSTFNRTIVLVALILAACVLAFCGVADSTILAVINALAVPVAGYVAVKGKGKSE